MQHQYTNIAFISYKREDERWAKWLQRKLEHYRIPSIVCEENPNAPKKLRPIFRDKTDLAAGTLEGGLRQALLDSHFLIVICSPNATKSDYVNLEAQTFVDAGRATDIIPFIVKGVPYAKDKTQECYPKALLNLTKEQVLLGVNIQEVGKQKALVRVAAHILGVRFDTLWGRYRRFLIRLRILMAVLIMFVLGAATFAWDYTRIKYEYYADYVDTWGIPQGIIPLTKEQINHRWESYKFEYRRIPWGEPNAFQWRLKRLSLVNSEGWVIHHSNSEHVDRYAIMELDYDKVSGNMFQQTCLNSEKKVEVIRRFSDKYFQRASIVDFESPNLQGVSFLDNSILGTHENDESSMSSITRFIYERDKNGHIIQQTFHLNNDYKFDRSATCNSDGVYGMRYTLDSIGRILQVDFLNANGDISPNKYGVASKSYAYNSIGVLFKIVYYNQHGELTPCDAGFATRVYGSDDYGNLNSLTYYDVSGMLITNQQGYAQTIRKRGQHCEWLEETYLDSLGNLCMTYEGYAKSLVVYNKNGQIVEFFSYDTLNEPCTNDCGFFKETIKYDKKGRIKEQAYWDINGRLCASNIMGCHRIVCEYNDNTNY